MASLKGAMAAIRLAKTNRLFLSESKCTITTIRWMKYIVSATNIISQRISSEEHKYIHAQKSKIASYNYPDTKHLH